MITMPQLGTVPYIHGVFTQDGNPFDLTDCQIQATFTSTTTSESFTQHGVWNYDDAVAGTAHYIWSLWDTMEIDSYTMTVSIHNIDTDATVTTAPIDIEVVADPGTTTAFTI